MPQPRALPRGRDRPGRQRGDPLSSVLLLFTPEHSEDRGSDPSAPRDLAPARPSPHPWPGSRAAGLGAPGLRRPHPRTRPLAGIGGRRCAGLGRWVWRGASSSEGCRRCWLPLTAAPRRALSPLNLPAAPGEAVLILPLGAGRQPRQGASRTGSDRGQCRRQQLASGRVCKRALRAA